MSDQAKESITTSEAGKRGGETVKARYGPAYFQSIGAKGGQATKRNHGADFYEAIGRSGGKKGGDSTLARHGHQHYEAIGKKGGQRVKELIEAGKHAEATHASPRLNTPSVPDPPVQRVPYVAPPD
jgi:uncharacterized protein